MARRLRVKLNLSLIVAHLTREEGRAVSQADALKWLAEAGFERQDDEHWLVSEADLGQLDPSEVLEVYPLDEDA